MKKIHSAAALAIALLAVLIFIAVAVRPTLNPLPAEPTLGPEQFGATVTDEDSQQPVAGAKVTLELAGLPTQTGYTNPEGDWTFDVIPQTQQQNGSLSVEAVGYERYTYRINIYGTSSQYSRVSLRRTAAAMTLTGPLPPKTSTPLISEQIILVNNFFHWIDVAKSKDDLKKSWDLETSAGFRFKCPGPGFCDFAHFRDWWWEQQVAYKLYDCGAPRVDAVLQYYPRNRLMASTLTAPVTIIYILGRVGGELKINSAAIVQNAVESCRPAVTLP